MKKILVFVLVCLMLVSLVSCGGNGDKDKSTGRSDQPAGSESATDNGSQSGEEATGGKLSGKINVIEMDDRDPSALRGIRIDGNSAGTAGINGKAASLTDVRCIFELGEEIEFYPDADVEYYLRVWVIQHRDNQDSYKNAKFSDLMSGFVSYCDLHYPVDEDDPATHHWGSFHLDPGSCEAGYYDFVLTYEGKAIGVLQTRFFNRGELGNKSAAELEALMRG